MCIFDIQCHALRYTHNSCIPAHQDFSLSVSFSFRFPTTYGAHTRTPATSHASGGLTESILEEDWNCSSSEVYDCRHKFRTVKCLWKVSRLRDCDLPLPEAVMFVRVSVCSSTLRKYSYTYLEIPVLKLRVLIDQIRAHSGMQRP